MQKFYKPSRVAVIYVIMAVLLAVYMTTLYKLQLYDTGADENAWLAKNTTTQDFTLAADRGDILDRNGVRLVSTRPAYNISLSRDILLDRDDFNGIILELVHSAIDNDIAYNDTFPVTIGAPFTYRSDMTDTEKDRLDFYLGHFKNILKIDANISASDLIVKMKEHYGIDYTISISDARLIIGVRYEMEMRAIKSMNPYIFANDVSIDFLSLVKSRHYPGVNIETSAKRVYNTTYAAHLLGSIGKMNDEQYNNIYKPLGYSYNSVVGKDGTELEFEQYLHGTDGKQEVITSDNGTVMDVNTEEPPIPGNNVYLTIDIGLQAVCEDSLAAKIDLINLDRTEEERAMGGAVVVTDVKTGEVLACGSYPTYDPSTLSSNIADLLKNKSRPLYNRATMGTYNPGSTFKMVTALAGLKSGFITPSSTVFDTGKYTAYADYQPVCWIYNQTGHGHGIENVVTALRDSCNYFFYWLGDNIGIDPISDTASDFGLGAKTGIELPEATGMVATPKNLEIVASKNVGSDPTWYTSDTMISAIGQDINYFTPVQLANYVATIANGGIKYPLTILSSIRSADFTSVVYQPEHKALGTIDGKEFIPYLQEGMKLVASAGGTASSFSKYPVPVAAKTGTVQSITTMGTNLNNGVFVCYAPADNPEIAIALVVEKGQSGAKIMEIAKDIMDYYFHDNVTIGVVQDNIILP